VPIYNLDENGQIVQKLKRIVCEDAVRPEVFQKKLIKSGDVYELYEYDKPIVKNYKSKIKGGRGGSASAEEKEKNREVALNRAKRNLRRLINVNIGASGKFVTLTFRDNVTDLDYANNELKKFFKRLSYHLGVKVAYAYVIEFQKRGAIHYHVIMFNVPYIACNELKDIWGHGYIKINRIDNVDNVGAYVVKYMSKDLEDDRLEGRKCYGSSKNLKKSVEITDENEIAQVLVALEQTDVVTYQNNFSNDYYNINYTQIKVKK